MRPALSVILFTTASGAGLGLLALLGAMAAEGAPSLAPTGTLLGTTLLGLGLSVSTRHLGQPRRLLWAFTQWRSSWLSREAVAATATLLVAAAFATAVWLTPGLPVCQLLGLATAVLAAVTVICTAMIYASLRSIPSWHNRLVVPCYLCLAWMTGALLLLVLAEESGRAPRGLAAMTLAAVLSAWMFKRAYWRHIDRLPRPDAAAFGGLGRLLDPPLSDGGFVKMELGNVTPDRTARRQRSVAELLLFVVPLLLTLAGQFTSGTDCEVLGLAAVAVSAGGAFVERRLFFTQARHVSGHWLDRCTDLR